jgi:hypothetical protein
VGALAQQSVTVVVDDVDVDEKDMDMDINSNEEKCAAADTDAVPGSPAYVLEVPAVPSVRFNAVRSTATSGWAHLPAHLCGEALGAAAATLCSLSYLELELPSAGEDSLMLYVLEFVRLAALEKFAEEGRFCVRSVQSSFAPAVDAVAVRGLGPV